MTSSPRLRSASPAMRSPKHNLSTPPHLMRSQAVTIDLEKYKSSKHLGLGTGVVAGKEGLTVYEIQDGLLAKYNADNLGSAINIGDTITAVGGMSDSKRLAATLADPNLFDHSRVAFSVSRRQKNFEVNFGRRGSSEQVTLGVEFRQPRNIFKGGLEVQTVYNGLLASAGDQDSQKHVVAGDIVTRVNGLSHRSEMLREMSEWTRNPDRKSLNIQVCSGGLTTSPPTPLSAVQDGVTREELPGGIVFFAESKKRIFNPLIQALTSGSLPSFKALLAIIFMMIASCLTYDPTPLGSLPSLPSFPMSFAPTPAPSDSFDNVLLRHILQPSRSVEIVKLNNPMTTDSQLTCDHASTVIFSSCDTGDDNGVLQCMQNGVGNRNFFCKDVAWKQTFSRKHLRLNLERDVSKVTVEIEVQVCRSLSQKKNFCVASMMNSMKRRKKF